MGILGAQKRNHVIFIHVGGERRDYFELSANRYSVGRSAKSNTEEMQITIQGDVTLSRVHCRFLRDSKDEPFHVVNLSQNGTVVGRKRLSREGDASKPLRDNTRIRIGAEDTHMVYRILTDEERRRLAGEDPEEVVVASGDAPSAPEDKLLTPGTVKTMLWVWGLMGLVLLLALTGSKSELEKQAAELTDLVEMGAEGGYYTRLARKEPQRSVDVSQAEQAAAERESAAEDWKEDSALLDAAVIDVEGNRARVFHSAVRFAATRQQTLTEASAREETLTVALGLAARLDRDLRDQVKWICDAIERKQYSTALAEIRELLMLEPCRCELRSQALELRESLAEELK